MGNFQFFQSARNTARFLKGQHREPRPDACVIVGNGPSLRPETVAAIDVAAADVYISNFAFENPELFGRANVLGMVNPLVIEQAAEGLSHTYSTARAARTPVPTLLLPAGMSNQVSSVAAPVGVATAATPGFQLHYVRGASTQSTVTYFLLQVAFWVGYKRVTLIGVDNTYNQPAVAEGVVINQVKDDVNHFSSEYFRGRRWEAADTQRMAAVISLAATAYSTHDRVLSNSTVGGALDVLPRTPLGEVLEKARYGVAPVTLSWGKTLVLYGRSLMSQFGSRQALGWTLLVSALLAVIAVVIAGAQPSAVATQAATSGSLLCALVSIVIATNRLWERNTEVESLREFERRSRAAEPSPMIKTFDQLQPDKHSSEQN